MTRIAVTGSSGLENPDTLSSPEERYSDTPFGKPSSLPIPGRISNTEVAPGANLTNEPGIPYATIAMSTDYDSRKQDEVPDHKGSKRKD